jgi:hypothetical protein
MFLAGLSLKPNGVANELHRATSSRFHLNEELISRASPRVCEDFNRGVNAIVGG